MSVQCMLNVKELGRTVQWSLSVPVTNYTAEIDRYRETSRYCGARAQHGAAPHSATVSAVFGSLDSAASWHWEAETVESRSGE